MKFVLTYNKGDKWHNENLNRSSYVLIWLDNDDKKITSWCWHGNDAAERMTRKLQQIKKAVPDMVLEHG